MNAVMMFSIGVLENNRPASAYSTKYHSGSHTGTCNNSNVNIVTVDSIQSPGPFMLAALALALTRERDGHDDAGRSDDTPRLRQPKEDGGSVIMTSSCRSRDQSIARSVRSQVNFKSRVKLITPAPESLQQNRY